MKYIWKNDISYLIHKRKIMLLLLFGIPCLLFLLYWNTKDSMMIYHMMFGTNLNFETTFPLEILMYLFQISFYIYFMVLLYMKDIETQLDTIFLRLSPRQWFLKKTMLLLLFIFLLKLVSYGIPFLLFKFTHITVSMDTVGLLFLTDVIYIVTVFMISLTLWMISTYSKWSAVVSGIIGLGLLLLFPKNISGCISHRVLMIGIILILVLINTIYITKYYYKLMQKFGGI